MEMNERSPQSHTLLRDDMRYTIAIHQCDKLEFDAVGRKKAFRPKTEGFLYEGFWGTSTGLSAGDEVHGLDIADVGPVAHHIAPGTVEVFQSRLIRRRKCIERIVHICHSIVQALVYRSA